MTAGHRGLPCSGMAQSVARGQRTRILDVVTLALAQRRGVARNRARNDRMAASCAAHVRLGWGQRLTQPKGSD